MATFIIIALLTFICLVLMMIYDEIRKTNKRLKSICKELCMEEKEEVI